jgi:uncharacterized repeat protein (TIGR02543 family)
MRKKRIKPIAVAVMVIASLMAGGLPAGGFSMGGACVYAEDPATPAAVAEPDAGASDVPDADNMRPKLVTDPYRKPTYARLIRDIKELKERYPGLVDDEYIGESVSGMKIPLVRFGTGKRKALVTAAIHGREFVTTAFVMRTIDTYAYAWARGKKVGGVNVRKALKNVTYYFVPMYNPDGVAIATGHASAGQKSLAVKAVGRKSYRSTRRLWKANARGVNLNRNWHEFWHDQGKDAYKASYIGGSGKTAASEPETQALMKLCEENDFAFLINCHTRGAVLYWNDWFSMRIPGADALTGKIARTTGYARTPTDRKNAGGTFEKWFRYTYNRPAVVIEFTKWTQAYQKACAAFDNAVSWSRTKTLWLKLAPYAKLTGKYKLYYNGNGGKVRLKQSSVTRYKNVTKGKKIGKLARAGRKGYVFKGWYTKKKGGERVTAKTLYEAGRSMVVYARWERK